MELSNKLRGLREDAFIFFIQEHISKILNDNEKLKNENEFLKKQNEILKRKIKNLAEIINDFQN